MSRGQYCPERCGACGKKGAYLIGYEDTLRVRCRYCGADQLFPRYPIDGWTTWPGTLAEAAGMLRPAAPEKHDG